MHLVQAAIPRTSLAQVGRRATTLPNLRQLNRNGLVSKGQEKRRRIRTIFRTGRNTRVRGILRIGVQPKWISRAKFRWELSHAFCDYAIVVIAPACYGTSRMRKLRNSTGAPSDSKHR